MVSATRAKVVGAVSIVKRVVTHPRFAPTLAVAALVWGAAVVALLRFGPGAAPWVDRLLVACFGWNAATRQYRLDTLLVALLQPPLFVGVLAVVYGEDLRAFLRSARGRAVGWTAAALFVGLAAHLLATGEVTAGGTPGVPAGPIRDGRPGPAFALVDHRSAAVSAVTLRGVPVVLTFVYTDCHATCPVLIGRLKTLEAQAAPDVVFAAVTLDPARDTPARLAAYGARWGLGARWRLLGGEPAAVHRLLADYGVQWTLLPEGEIAHENVVVLLDRAGRVAFTYRGLAHPAERVAADLARLAAERG